MSRQVFDWAATEREFPPIVGPGRGRALEDPPIDLDDCIHWTRFLSQLPEASMPTSSPLPTPITVDVKERFVFTQARRTATTTVSDFVVPAGLPIIVDGQVQYPSEPYRVAVEPNGEGVYPILESIFQETYVEVSADA